MASKLYDNGALKLTDGTVLFLTDTIKMMLVRDTYVFDPAHTFVSSVASAELSVTGYTGGYGGAGRRTLASKTLTLDAPTHRVRYKAANITWTALAAGQTIGGAVLIKEISTDANSHLIAFLDPTDLILNGSDVTMAPDATDGLFYLQN